MGFRSTFITEDVNVKVPKWFRDKWGKMIHWNKVKNSFLFPLSSAWEAKTYGIWLDLEEDLKKILAEQKDDWWLKHPLIVVYLHECGGITRLEVYKDKVLYSEPESWKQVDGVTHDYCYGCSDIGNK